VVHIPLGCETWSLPRKRRRGRTIGCFGFPGRHKGLERLGGALRKLGGCDIVLFSHRFDPASTWPAELPLRVETGWLALPEVAGRLAAEADVLVFHYDEIPHASASSAVLLGLSTGVPVLASATSWFADLGAAVHRAEPDALAAELERLLEDDDLRATTTASAREYCAEHSWSRIAARHVDLWNSIEAV
jgi:glycosyltransferase involved in cell wall biosynthesis